MTDLHTTWRATFTRRWHTNPDLCHTHDPVGAHSVRVALIIWTLWPDSPRDLILAALTHDLAESIVGDLPPSGKAMLANAATAERLIATQNGWHVPTDHTEKLTFADKLDAYLWASHHGAANGAEWDNAWEWLRYSAERLGVGDNIGGML